MNEIIASKYNKIVNLINSNTKNSKNDVINLNNNIRKILYEILEEIHEN